MTEQITPVANPALTPLANIEDNVLIQDMNYLFHYERVKKPDGNPSHLFALHYREEQQEQWASCKTLLTNVFTVARTEAVIAQIQENLEGNVENEQHYRSTTSVKSSFTLSGYQITLEDEPDVDKLLFKLITNVDAEIELLTSAGLTFNVINGFSGNHALQLNYGLMKTMRTNNDENTRIIPVNNVFLLDKYTNRLIHDSRLTISIEDVTNVQQQITRQVADFKRAPVSLELVNEFTEKFPKKFGKKFVAMFDNIPENLRNFYYCSYVWSSLLDSERKIALEIKLRAFVAEKIDEIIRALDASENITTT